MIRVSFDTIADQFRQMMPPQGLFPGRGPTLPAQTSQEVAKEDRGFPGAPPRTRTPYGRQVVYAILDILNRLHLLQGGRLNEIFALVAEVNSRLLLSESYFPIRKSINTESKTRPYRDHVLHTTVVFLLGRHVLQRPVGGGDFLSHLAADTAASKLGRDALVFAGVKPTEMNMEKWKSALLEAWGLAALSHDLAYAIEPAIDLEMTFFSHPFLANNTPTHSHMQKGILSDLKSALNTSESGLTTAGCGVAQEYFIAPSEEALDERYHKLNHGQFLALILLQAFSQHRILPRLRASERLVLFLALVASYRHDEWSKPDFKDLSVKTDPWSIFFSFIDLLAEIRLIWATPQFKPCDLTALWRLQIWLPISVIEIDPTDAKWKFTFIIPASLTRRLVGVKEDWQIGDYIYSAAVGYGNSALAKEKQEQYQCMLKHLGLLHADGVVSVEMSVEGSTETTVAA
jgi:hypothetical protein